MKNDFFVTAVPVWEKGKETEMNYSLVFTAAVSGSEPAKLVIAAHSRYQIFINGVFFAAGPARAGHGSFRVNEYGLTDLSDGENRIEFITAGYNANSYYLTDQPSFLCAEIRRADEVIAATSKNITARRYSERLRKVQRYSFQRPFTEVYDLNGEVGKPVEISECGEKKFIGRKSPYCEYDRISASRITASGSVSSCVIPKKFKDRSFLSIGDKLKGYRPEELECCSVNEAYKLKSKFTSQGGKFIPGMKIPADGTALFDMGKITTGYIELEFTAEKAGTLFAVINELLPENGIPDPGRDGCANVIKWELGRGGDYHLISFEPYDYKYIQLIFLSSAAQIRNVSQIRETYPESKLTNIREMPDEELKAIYNAAKESFVQNATDIFMDCPGRERAGWLCDSFFTSRVEYSLTGKSLVEHDFLENFLMPEKFGFIPEGMLPMCYPSDHYDGTYIHNWAMWYVLELKEYFDRTGDRELIDRAKEKVLSLLKFTEKYENEKGLLQKLESWVFVEWSEANGFVQDINYPTNMLYSVMLDTIAGLYSMPELAAKAEKLRKTIIEESFDGEFFTDNAVLDKNGKAVRTSNRTETCQYYAFFSGTATKETFPELFDRMMNEFGSGRDNKKTYPDIPRSNAFIGNYLRLELMFRYGMYDRLISDVRAFFLPMARETGTLWENMSSGASCNHGFASHVIYWLNSIL